MLVVPLLVGGGVNLDDGALDEGVGAHILVRGSVVDDVEDTGLAGHGLAGPGEVTSVEAEGTVLESTTADTDAADLLLSDLGVGGLATELEFPFHADADATTTRAAALVDRITRNTCGKRISMETRENTSLSIANGPMGSIKKQWPLSREEARREVEGRRGRREGEESLAQKRTVNVRSGVQQLFSSPSQEPSKASKG